MLAGRNLFPVLAALLISVTAGTACAQQAALVLTSAERAALERGEPQAFIVLFDDRPFETALRAPAGRPPRTAPQSELQATRVAHYRALRSRARASNAGEEWQAEYSHLPLATVRFSSLASLHKFRGNTVVRAIYPNRAVRPSLDTASRNLVQQPVAAQIGADGAGATVVIIDTGVDYTRGAFGYCTAAGVPASCRVAYYANIVDNSPSLDSSGHGTNVAGVVAGLGSGLRIAMINIFGASSISYDSYVLDAINWALANQSAFNIRAVNMSFGDGNNNTTPCSNPVLNPYTFAVSALRDAGIVPVAAAGNERYTNGLSSPACTPGVVSVGAVYSANVGSVGLGGCNDPTTNADQVTCFSNSASFLTLLAPGAFVSAADITLSGTSQATPFVAATAAILRGAYPSERVEATITRLTSGGIAITDPRNGVTTPRLQIVTSIRPSNDAFSSRIAISGMTGTVSGNNQFASNEAGEPAHAGIAANRSVWWRWLSPISGQVAINTSGSGNGTALSAYTGSSFATLDPRGDLASGASGSTLFQATTGTEYAIALETTTSTGGPLTLNWSVNSSAAADLRATVTPSAATVAAPGPQSLSLTVLNQGPQTATNVRVIAALPLGITVSAFPPSCSAVSNNFLCALGTLNPGANIPITLQVSGLTLGATTINFSAQSDLPDPSNGNNAATTTITASGNASVAHADIPTLPEWGALLLGALLLSGARKHRRCHH